MKSEQAVRQKYWEIRDEMKHGDSNMTKDFDLGYMDALEWVLSLRINPAPQWVKDADYEE
jgi:hypothetical protein